MKRFILFLFAAMSSICASAQFYTDWRGDPSRVSIDVEQCQWVWINCIPHETKQLYGNVYVAKEGESYDLLIREARKDEMPDMWVGIVKKYPDECGLWMWTNDRKMAALVVKFTNKVGKENLIVKFVDGEKMRHYTDLPCWDYSSGTRQPCK